MHCLVSNHPKHSITKKVNIKELILILLHFPQVYCSSDNIKTHEIKLSEGSILRRFKRWPQRPVIPEKAFKLPQTCNFELMFLHTIFLSNWCFHSTPSFSCIHESKIQIWRNAQNDKLSFSISLFSTTVQLWFSVFACLIVWLRPTLYSS